MDEARGTAVIVINGFLSFIGTLGNVLIIFAVLKTPHLRQRPSNHLIMSLAVADLVVTMIVQPLYVTSTALKTFKGRCNLTLDMALGVVGPFSSSSSAFHLAAISIDRTISAFKPHQHREIIKKWSKMMLGICWGIAFLFEGLLIPFPKANFVGPTFILISEIIMICSYCMILYKVKHSSQSTVSTPSMPTYTARERAIENRMSATIAIVILLFAACWFPLVGFAFANPNVTFICSFNMELTWVRTLLLANSSMNFIVYSLRIRQFRSAYMRIINRMLLPFAEGLRKCFYKSSMQQNNNVR